MSAIRNNSCFDLDLKQIEDLDFFFISSKDNIVTFFDNKLKCYKRKELLKDSVKFLYLGNIYYIIELNNKPIVLTEKAYNHLSYNYYSIYKFNKVKYYKKYGDIYEVMSYKFKEYYYF
jgi:hypothetical protein